MGERVSELTLFLNQIIKSYWWYLVVMFYHRSFFIQSCGVKNPPPKSTCPTTIYKGLLLFHVQKAGEQAVNIGNPLGIPVGIHHPFPHHQLNSSKSENPKPLQHMASSQGFQRCARDLEANSSIVSCDHFLLPKRFPHEKWI